MFSFVIGALFGIGIYWLWDYRAEKLYLSDLSTGTPIGASVARELGFRNEQDESRVDEVA